MFNSFQAEVIVTHAAPEASSPIYRVGQSTGVSEHRPCYIPGATWLVLRPVKSRRPVSLEDASVPRKALWLERYFLIARALSHKSCTQRLFGVAAVVSTYTLSSGLVHPSPGYWAHLTSVSLPGHCPQPRETASLKIKPFPNDWQMGRGYQGQAPWPPSGTTLRGYLSS